MPPADFSLQGVFHMFYILVFPAMDGGYGAGWRLVDEYWMAYRRVHCQNVEPLVPGTSRLW